MKRGWNRVKKRVRKRARSMSEKRRAQPAQPEGGARGTLIVIGGHEDKTDGKVILAEVARIVGSGRLIVCTAASHEPEGYFEPYERAFHDLGVKDVVELHIDERADAFDERNQELLASASGLFFTGGDQLRLASQMGDTP